MFPGRSLSHIKAQARKELEEQEREQQAAKHGVSKIQEQAHGAIKPRAQRVSFRTFANVSSSERVGSSHMRR